MNQNLQNASAGDGDSSPESSSNKSVTSQHQTEQNELRFLEQVIRYQDGSLSEAETLALSQQLSAQPQRLAEFIDLQMQSAEVNELLRRQAYAVTPEKEGERFAPDERRSWSRGSLGVLAALCGAALVWAGQQIPFPFRESQQIATDESQNETQEPAPLLTAIPAETAQSGQVVLMEGVRVDFFGRGPIATGSNLPIGEDLMLLEGLVKLAFPTGATAIIEAPAMFRIVDAESIALDTGACSVHAPQGAEGFRVLTPLTKVVDRGTRFSVKVNDNSETEVHVVEGAADLYPPDQPEQTVATAVSARREKIRLTDQQAALIGAFDSAEKEATHFDSRHYRGHLPDRIVRYEATRTPEGFADELLSVSVQRNGQVLTYPIDEIIPIEVIWFGSDPGRDKIGHLLGDQQVPVLPQRWLEDRSLRTGLINPGGNSQPLQTSPVLERGPNGTPGIGFRFHSPVTNGPGPDVVLFEVQTFTNPLDGDAFHISPLQFRPGLKTHTVRQFDLTLRSPESLSLPPFYLHRYPSAVMGLEDLVELESQVSADVRRLPFRAIAVGIDLSDLGYAEGEQVDALFLQHALEKGAESSRVDPVFIGGLPTP